MKKIVLVFIGFILFGCSSNKMNNTHKRKLITEDDVFACGGIISNNILFEVGKIIPRNLNKIENLYAIMKEHSDKEFSVEAHTDEIEFKMDTTLGKKRLEYVKNFFIEKGIDSKSLFMIDYKDKRPKETNETEVGRANNRRIEVKVRE